jgi:hypothetical protein
MLDRLRPSLRPVYVAVSRLMPSTRDTWLMVARKPVGWTPKFELDDQEFRRLTGLKSWSEAPHSEDRAGNRTSKPTPGSPRPAGTSF